MKSFKTSYSDTEFPIAVQAICDAYKYKNTIVNDDGETIKNPMTKRRFAQIRVDKWLSNITGLDSKKRKIKEATKDLTFDNLTIIEEQ